MALPGPLLVQGSHQIPPLDPQIVPRYTMELEPVNPLVYCTGAGATKVELVGDVVANELRLEGEEDWGEGEELLDEGQEGLVSCNPHRVLLTNNSFATYEPLL